MNRESVSFWNKSKKIIKMINPGDINIAESLTKMGLLDISSFLGVCDVGEVIERNQVMHFLYNNHDIRKDVVRLSEMENKMQLPVSENSFLYFYSKVENPYWDEVKKLAVKIKAVPKLPKGVQKFVNQLEADLALEAQERKMADAISPLLSGVASMEGTFSVSASFIKNDSSEKGYNYLSCNSLGEGIFDMKVYGYKLFDMSYASEYQAELPKFLKRKFFRWTYLTSLFQSIANKRLKSKAKSSSLISVVTQGVKRDLSVGFNNIFKGIKISNNDIVWLDDVKFDFYFRYDSNGLYVEMLSLRVKEREDCFDWSFASNVASIKPSLNKQLKKKREVIKGVVAVSVARSRTEPLFHATKKLIGSKIKVSAVNTDSDYKWYAIGHIYNSEKFADVYGELCDQRKFFFDTLKNLTALSDILTNFENQAVINALPLCIPTISAGHDGVFFKNLVPISLVGSGLTSIIPITLDRINGQMVGLTGRHGGGKTTIGKNVLQNVYFAQSGLPVFAESFNTDIKTVLGAVTNDEGAGSTATVFVQKVTNLMKEIKEVPVHESLVFIDEIGKGTQQEAGMELGKAILSALSKGGNSVLFNTQILELAEYAQNSLHAVCYKANKKFEFTKGISGGEINELVKELGLDKFLN